PKVNSASVHWLHIGCAKKSGPRQADGLGLLERVLRWQAARLSLGTRRSGARTSRRLLAGLPPQLQIFRAVGITESAATGMDGFGLRLESLPDHVGIGRFARRESAEHRLAAGAIDPHPADA